MALYNVYTPDTGQHKSGYHKLALSNPYATVSYRKSWMQRLLTGLGFRTNKDAYLESMVQQAREYDNNLLQKEYDETYDHPAAQSERMRSAGLNPDLSGDITPGSSEPLRDDGNPPVAPEADDVDIASNFAGAVLQGVQIAFGLYSSIQGFASQSLANRAQRIANMSAFTGLVDDALLHTDSPVMTGDMDSDNSVYTIFRDYGPYKRMFSRKEFKAFREAAHNFSQGLSYSGKSFELRKRRADDRQGYYRTTSDESSYSEFGDVMTAISGPLTKLAYDLVRSRTRNDQKYEDDVRSEELVNAGDYAKEFDGTAAARYDQETSRHEAGIKRAESEMARLRSSLRGTYESIFEKLHNLSKQGYTSASVVEVVLATMLLRYITL